MRLEKAPVTLRGLVPMTRNHENQICRSRTRQDASVDELRLVGGQNTLEGHKLTAAAGSIGISVRWLDFASEEAQAAIAAQGPGAVRLPLVILRGNRMLQRPQFSEVSACLAALSSDESRHQPHTRDPRGSLWTVIGSGA